MNRSSPPGSRHDGLAVVAILTWITAALLLGGQALVAGDDMLRLQIEGRGAGPAGNFVAGAVVALALLGVGVVCASRISSEASWRGALVTYGAATAGLGAVLVAIAAAQGSLAMSIADAGLVPRGATAPGQVVSFLTGLVLLAAACPCLVAGRRRHASSQDPGGRTPV